MYCLSNSKRACFGENSGDYTMLNRLRRLGKNSSLKLKKKTVFENHIVSKIQKMAPFSEEEVFSEVETWENRKTNPGQTSFEVFLHSKKYHQVFLLQICVFASILLAIQQRKSAEFDSKIHNPTFKPKQDRPIF